MDFPLAPIPSIAVGELSVGTASTVNSRRKRAAGGAPPSPRSTKRSTYSETERSPLDRAGSDTARSSEPRSRPMCFRISNVPLTWGKEDLVEHLKRVGFVDKGHNRVSLYPACSGDGQVALLNLVEYFEWFRQLSITGSDTLPGCGSETNLQIDRHFYGLTPLNNPKKNIAAEFVTTSLSFLSHLEILIAIRGVQCCCCNRARWTCVWVVEKSDEKSDVAPRFPSLRVQQHSDHDLRLRYHPSVCRRHRSSERKPGEAYLGPS